MFRSSPWEAQDAHVLNVEPMTAARLSTKAARGRRGSGRDLAKRDLNRKGTSDSTVVLTHSLAGLVAAECGGLDPNPPWVVRQPQGAKR